MTPTIIKLHQATKKLAITFDDGSYFELPHEYLRVFSPSAEVQGHAPGQQVLQIEKADVFITKIDPIGQYAIKPTFSDGHDSGIFSWEVLYQLAINYHQNWDEYLSALKKADQSQFTN